jgi:hypothetical protein
MLVAALVFGLVLSCTSIIDKDPLGFMVGTTLLAISIALSVCKGAE